MTKHVVYGKSHFFKVCLQNTFLKYTCRNQVFAHVFQKRVCKQTFKKKMRVLTCQNDEKKRGPPPQKKRGPLFTKSDG